MCYKLAGVLNQELVLGDVLGREEAVSATFELRLAEHNNLSRAALQSDILASRRV